MGRLVDRWRLSAFLLLAAATCLLTAAPPVGAEPTTGTITGRVTDSAGHPLGPASHMCALLGSSSSGWSNLNADGTYTIDNVPPGLVSVRFDYCGGDGVGWEYAPEYYPNIHERESTAGAALPNINVAAGQTVTGIDAQLEPGGTMTVAAVDASSTPLAGLCVLADRFVSTVATPQVGNLAASYSGKTAADGKVTLTGLSAGSYTVQVRACTFADTPYPALTRYEYAGGSFTPAAAQRFRIDPGTTLTPTVVMAKGADVSGTVTRDGQPVGGTCVTWDARDGSEQISTSTAADGTYTIPALTPTVPGKLKACGDASSVSTWSPNAASRWTAEVTAPAAGQHLVRNVVLQHGATLSVIVQSLPDSTGCQAVVTDSTGATQHLALRSSGVAGVFTADAFGLATSGRAASLECNGSRVGVGRVPELGSPLWQNWDNDAAPVVSIIYDVFGPDITPAASNGGRWVRTPVQVSFTCADAGVGVATCPGPVTLGEGQTTNVTATDKAGNVTARVIGPMLVDSTPPRPAIYGDGRTFKRNELVALGCNMADDRSGIAWVRSNCPAWATPASAVGIGDHTYTVFAADNAGNIGAVYTTIHIVK